MQPLTPILLAFLTVLPAVVQASPLSQPLSQPVSPPLPQIETEDGLDAGAARAAVLRGEILPLERILEIVRRDFAGEIVEIQLEIEDGVLVYEFDILSPAGRLDEVEIDAATGRILEVEEDDDD